MQTAQNINGFKSNFIWRGLANQAECGCVLSASLFWFTDIITFQLVMNVERYFNCTEIDVSIFLPALSSTLLLINKLKNVLTGISSCGKLAWVPISSSSCLMLSTDCWLAGEFRRLSSASWFSFGKGLNLKLLCEDA